MVSRTSLSRASLSAGSVVSKVREMLSSILGVLSTGGFMGATDDAPRLDFGSIDNELLKGGATSILVESTVKSSPRNSETLLFEVDAGLRLFILILFNDIY